jgi:ubiquinone/menaquinone biosynthesis C-methylase UbiE
MVGLAKGKTMKPSAERVEPDFHYRLMALTLKLRDLFLPRKNILKEVGVKPGFYVLDYGCGPGSCLRPLAELVGHSGKIYALDIHPLAIRMVKKLAAKNKLTNVQTIHSHCKTGLPDSSVDAVLLYDTYHNLNEPNEVLKELHRVLKPDGVLSFTDHHMKKDEIISKVTSEGLFRLSRKGKRTYSFVKGDNLPGC